MATERESLTDALELSAADRAQLHDYHLSAYGALEYYLRLFIFNPQLPAFCRKPFFSNGKSIISVLLALGPGQTIAAIEEHARTAQRGVD
ncbi:MAG: hypothetical protein M3N19_08360 [Candidatus Eremiobacteraeota bacterium]|nr:hypothetical protein [Candidatus Eremiobacteraeota bacterium]